MAETLVKIPICSKCGEEARPQALFCFACGGKIVGYTEEEESAVSAAWFRGDIVETPSDDAGDPVAKEEQISESKPDTASVGSDAEVEEKAIPMPSVAEDTGSKIKVKAKDVEGADQEKDSSGKLTSAAELRRRPKAIQTKRVEVVWEQAAEGPNIPFLIFGTIVGIVGIVLFFVAFYLK